MLKLIFLKSTEYLAASVTVAGLLFMTFKTPGTLQESILILGILIMSTYVWGESISRQWFPINYEEEIK